MPVDFEVRDNGVLQQVDFAAFEQIPLNVVLALDMSSSVKGSRLAHLRSAGRALLDGLTARESAVRLACERGDLIARLTIDPSSGKLVSLAFDAWRRERVCAVGE